MNNLKSRIEYFLDLRGKITQGEWVIEDRLTENMTEVDEKAILKLPQALDLIAELLGKLERTERRLNVFIEAEASREEMLDSEAFSSEFFATADKIFTESIHQEKPIQSIQYKTCVEYAKLLKTRIQELQRKNNALTINQKRLDNG